MAPKTIPFSLNNDLENVDRNWQDCPSFEQKKETEPLQIKAQREKEKKYSEWAESVLAGKTNLSLVDWMSRNSSKR